MKDLRYNILILISVIFLYSCSASKEPDIAKHYESKFNEGLKYYNENNFKSAYKIFDGIYWDLSYNGSFMIMRGDYAKDKVQNYTQKVTKIGLECEDNYKKSLIDKCLEAIDNKYFTAASIYINEIPRFSRFNSIKYSSEIIDSLNFAIGLRLFNDDEYYESLLFFGNIKNKTAKEDFILPILIEIGNKAVDNNDANFATNVLAFIMKEFWGNQKYFKDIQTLGTKFDELRNLKELKKFTETQFEINGVAFIIKSAANWSNDNEFMQPRDGFKFYVLDVILINIDSKAKYINTIGFYLADDEGYKYETSWRGKKPNLINGYLQPGEKTRGYLTFEILNNTNHLELNYIFYKL